MLKKRNIPRILLCADFSFWIRAEKCARLFTQLCLLFGNKWPKIQRSRSYKYLLVFRDCSSLAQRSVSGFMLLWDNFLCALSIGQKKYARRFGGWPWILSVFLSVYFFVHKPCWCSSQSYLHWEVDGRSVCQQIFWLHGNCRNWFFSLSFTKAFHWTVFWVRKFIPNPGHRSV